MAALQKSLRGKPPAAILAENTVGRPRSKTKEGQPVNLGFRAPHELIAAIDEEAKRMAEDAGLPVSRSAAAMKLLREALEARRKARSEPK